MLLFVGPLDPRRVAREVEWSTLLFFVGLFMLVEAIVHVGLIRGTVADGLSRRRGRLGSRPSACCGSAAFASAIVDNIPYTAT